MISLPGMLIIAEAGQQITDLSIAQFRTNLSADSKVLLAMLNSHDDPSPDLEVLAANIDFSSGEPIAFAIESRDGQQLISNPSLFNRLQTDYSPKPPPFSSPRSTLITASAQGNGSRSESLAEQLLALPATTESAN
jgi:hypothetical protein